MTRWLFGAGLVGLAVVMAGTARADRTPPTRVPSAPPATGSRPDITVPYTTDGRSTLMGVRVEPRIYSSQIVNDPRNPGARPVFNLQFYGSRMSFGSLSNGAVSVPGAIPLPNR